MISLLVGLTFLIVAFFGDGKSVLLLFDGKKLNELVVLSLSFGLTLLRDAPLYNAEMYLI